MSEHSGETTILRQGSFVAGGRAVEAGHGWAWIADGWDVFKKSPGLWIGMIVVLLLIFFAMNFIPVVGMVAATILQPVFGAGLMIACRKIDVGEPPLFSDLFAGFRTQFGRMATLGALYLAGTVVMIGAGVLVGGVGILSLGEARPGPEAATAILLAALAIMALAVPLAMAFWFAVPLALFNEQGALDAVKGSFAGCLRNIVPFLLYGVIGFLLAIVASIPLGLGWLVLGPVFVASIYTGYKDIYLS
jgi:hypothetical protein